MNPPVADIKIGDTVRFDRGGVWLTGEVIQLGRSVAFIREGDDFLGYRTYVENLILLKSTQKEL